MNRLQFHLARRPNRPPATERARVCGPSWRRTPMSRTTQPTGGSPPVEEGAIPFRQPLRDLCNRLGLNEVGHMGPMVCSTFGLVTTTVPAPSQTTMALSTSPSVMASIRISEVPKLTGFS